MEGACDPPKLVSQFLLRKTVVQVRRRILQCCRPGTPDNIVKAFRYQQVVWSMPVACRRVDPAVRRPPVEREQTVLPLWLVRSLPVIYPTIKHFNNPSGSGPEAPPSCRRGKARHSHLAFVRSAPDTYSFPPGTRYPPRLPTNLDFKRMGFVLLQQLLPSPPRDLSSASEGPLNTSSPSSPLQSLSPEDLLQRLHPTKADKTPDIISASTVSSASMEQISRHCRTLAGLRRRKSAVPPAARKLCLNEREKRRDDKAPAAAPFSPEGSASFQEKGEDAIIVNNEEEKEEEVEEESDLLLALSESSPSVAGSIAHEDDLSHPKEAESESEQEVTVVHCEAVEEEKNNEGASSDDSRASVMQLQELLSSDETGDDEDDQRELEDMMFAQDYLHRVCEAVKGCSGLSKQLLHILDEFSAAGPSEASGTLEVLYNRLSSVLQPWPQLLKDFAAFLNTRQARSCGLLLEQQLFERSRRFLRRLGQNLGENSSLYQQVVSVLQGSSAPSSEDFDKVSSLLEQHPDLQEEVQEFFQQLHTCSSPETTSSSKPNMDSVSQNPHDKHRKTVSTHKGSDGEEEGEQQAVCAKNMAVTSNGKKVVVWTRDADRIILTACQQRGANRSTFRQVSSQLGNKTAQQVRFRFQDLMKLFHSASQKSTSCSYQPASKNSAAPD